MINMSQVFMCLIILLLYKNLLMMFALGPIIKFLATGLMITIFFLSSILFIKNNVLRGKMTVQAIAVTMNLFLVLIITLITLFRMPEVITPKFIFLSVNQIALPAMFAFSLENIVINYDILLNKILKFSWPIILFAFFEMMLPIGVKQYFFEKILMVKFGSSIDFSLSSYIFQDFGIFLYRSGSLFFEPITLSLFTAELFIIAYIIRYRPKLPIVLANFVSIGKSGFLILASCLLARIFRRYYFGYFIAIFLVIVIIFTTVVAKFDEVALASIFFTAKAHIQGLFSGIINGTKHPYLGHGMGTAGYLVYWEAFTTGNMAVFDNPENIIPGNGNESFIGIVIYQLGYVYYALYTFMYYIFAKKLVAMRQYVILGFLCAYYTVGFFTESVATLLPMILSYLIVYSVIGRKPIAATKACLTVIK